MGDFFYEAAIDSGYYIFNVYICKGETIAAYIHAYILHTHTDIHI